MEFRESLKRPGFLSSLDSTDKRTNRRASCSVHFRPGQTYLKVYALVRGERGKVDCHGLRKAERNQWNALSYDTVHTSCTSSRVRMLCFSIFAIASSECYRCRACILNFRSFRENNSVLYLRSTIHFRSDSKTRVFFYNSLTYSRNLLMCKAKKKYSRK